MTELKQLVKDLAEAKKLATMDMEAVPWNTRPSITMMVNEAKERLGKLRDEYSRRLRSNTLGIFIFGDPARVAKFVEIAAEEAGVSQIPGDALYQRLASKVEATLGSQREFGPTQLQGVIQDLRDLSKEMDIRHMVMPRLQELTAVNNRTELVNHIRKLVQSAVGDDLLRLVIDRKITDTAVDQQFFGKVFPVVVTGLDPQEVPSLASLFTNTVSVEVGTSEDGEVNKDYVLNQLSAFRKKIKSKTNETA